MRGIVAILDRTRQQGLRTLQRYINTQDAAVCRVESTWLSLHEVFLHGCVACGVCERSGERQRSTNADVSLSRSSSGKEGVAVVRCARYLRRRTLQWKQATKSTRRRPGRKLLESSGISKRSGTGSLTARLFLGGWPGDRSSGPCHGDMIIVADVR